MKSLNIYLDCAFQLLAVGLTIGVVYGVMILLALGILDIFNKITTK